MMISDATRESTNSCPCCSRPLLHRFAMGRFVCESCDLEFEYEFMDIPESRQRKMLKPHIDRCAHASL